MGLDSICNKENFWEGLFIEKKLVPGSSWLLLVVVELYRIELRYVARSKASLWNTACVGAVMRFSDYDCSLFESYIVLVTF